MQILKSPNTIIKFLSIAFMVYLIGFPSIYKAMHQVFSSHHHFKYCSHHDKKSFHNKEATCLIAQFDFLAQFQHQTDHILRPLFDFNRKQILFVTMAYAGDRYFTSSSRAPPIS